MNVSCDAIHESNAWGRHIVDNEPIYLYLRYNS